MKILNDQTSNKITNIAIFASGSGTNAEAIIRFVADEPLIKVAVIICNNPNAGVIAKAHHLGIKVELISGTQTQDDAYLLQLLNNYRIQWVALAGYLKKIPMEVIQAFENKIINIHPSLLPKYGGKGMYGMHVHQAVLDAKEKETGFTIHFVNEEYDKGAIIFQHKISIADLTTPQQIAESLLKHENKYFPIQLVREIKNNWD